VTLSTFLFFDIVVRLIVVFIFFVNFCFGSGLRYWLFNPLFFWRTLLRNLWQYGMVLGLGLIRAVTDRQSDGEEAQREKSCQ